MVIAFVVGAVLVFVAGFATAWLLFRPRQSAATMYRALQALETTMDTVVPLVQFAVGNLDPRTVRGWPVDKLRDFVRTYRASGAGGIIEKELMDELEKFAQEAEVWEKQRGPRRVGIEGLPIGIPEPLTGEAAEVWERATGLSRNGQNRHSKGANTPAAVVGELSTQTTLPVPSADGAPQPPPLRPVSEVPGAEPGAVPGVGPVDEPPKAA